MLKRENLCGDLEREEIVRTVKFLQYVESIIFFSDSDLQSVMLNLVPRMDQGSIFTKRLKHSQPVDYD